MPHAQNFGPKLKLRMSTWLCIRPKCNFFSKIGLQGGLYIKKVLFWSTKRHLLIKRPPQKPNFWNNFSFWPIGSSSRHFLASFRAKNFRSGAQVKPPMDLKSDAFHFFEVWNDTFLIKSPPKRPPLEKILPFDLLDHQVDTLSFILSPIF